MSAEFNREQGWEQDDEIADAQWEATESELRVEDEGSGSAEGALDFEED